jgi:glc operon protein GlcG
MSGFFAIFAAATMAAAAPAAPTAPAAAPVGYGVSITPGQASTIAATALAEKVRRGTDQLAIAVVDPAGRVIYFERQDNATYGNVDMAILKARASARLRRPTSADTARLKAGDQILLLVPGAFPADGGQPIVKNGLVIGALGLAGGGADGEVAVMAAKALD